MAHKKASYKDSAKKLKELGFVDYDLRRNLNNGQKSQITKLTRQYSQLLSHPEQFSIQKAPKGTKTGLKTAGFSVNKAGNAIIPLYEFDSARLVKGRVELKSAAKSETIYLAGSREFFDKLRHLNDTREKLKRNQMLTVQIGDNNSFSTRFRSYWELYQYLTKFQPKDEGESRERLFARMSVVTIENNPKKSATRSKSYGQKKRGK